MRRVPMFLAAAVSSALIALAVLTLDSVGAQGSEPPAASTDLATRFTTCMRDRGIDMPVLDTRGLDRWVKTHRLPDADARACKTALADVADKAAGADARKKAAAEAACGGVRKEGDQ